MRELEGIQISEFKKGIIQIDINAPTSVDGMAFYSSQLQQFEPFMLIQIKLPWRKSGKLVGQFFFATEILHDPEVQVFYGSTDCGVLLKKKLDISTFKNKS